MVNNVEKKGGDILSVTELLVLVEIEVNEMGVGVVEIVLVSSILEVVNNVVEKKEGDRLSVTDCVVVDCPVNGNIIFVSAVLDPNSVDMVFVVSVVDDVSEIATVDSEKEGEKEAFEIVATVGPSEAGCVEVKILCMVVVDS